MAIQMRTADGDDLTVTASQESRLKIGSKANFENHPKSWKSDFGLTQNWVKLVHDFGGVELGKLDFVIARETA